MQKHDFVILFCFYYKNKISEDLYVLYKADYKTTLKNQHLSFKFKIVTMVNWKDTDVRLKMDEAKELQESFGKFLGDRLWDLIEKGDVTTLYSKIGFGLYGLPSIQPNAENFDTGYPPEGVTKIKKTASLLLKNLNFQTQDIHFGCIFIVCITDDQRVVLPIFKVKQVDSVSSVYVDTHDRVYRDWNNYLKQNVLPKCIYCYPTNGYYQFIENTIDVSFANSPACSNIYRIGRYLDTTFKVVGLGAAVIGIAAIPVAGPLLTASTVAGITCGVYGVASSSVKLADRGKHGQSISLKDSEARSHWLNLAASSLGMRPKQLYAAIGKSAKVGQVVQNAGKVVANVIKGGTLAASGLQLSNDVGTNSLQSLTSFQLYSSVLFFLHSRGSIPINLQSQTIEFILDALMSAPLLERGSF